MLQFLNLLLTIVHLLIIGFNLFGWIPRLTRKAHFISIVVTAASWLLLSIWFGLGYCPVTDWQWQVKEKLGERNVPGNFIEYFSEKISGLNFRSEIVDTVTAVSFLAVVLLSIYVNFIKPKRKKQTSLSS